MVEVTCTQIGSLPVPGAYEPMTYGPSPAYHGPLLGLLKAVQILSCILVDWHRFSSVHILFPATLALNRDSWALPHIPWALTHASWAVRLALSTPLAIGMRFCGEDNFARLSKTNIFTLGENVLPNACLQSSCST